MERIVGIGETRRDLDKFDRGRCTSYFLDGANGFTLFVKYPHESPVVDLEVIRAAAPGCIDVDLNEWDFSTTVGESYYLGSLVLYQLGLPTAGAPILLKDRKGVGMPNQEADGSLFFTVHTMHKAQVAGINFGDLVAVLEEQGMALAKQAADLYIEFSTDDSLGFKFPTSSEPSVMFADIERMVIGSRRSHNEVRQHNKRQVHKAINEALVAYSYPM